MLISQYSLAVAVTTTDYNVLVLPDPDNLPVANLILGYLLCCVPRERRLTHLCS